jgi:trigger factor
MTAALKIDETLNEGLVREFHVTVPERHYLDQIETQLKAIAADAKMPGFRAGKVPLNLVRQRYETSAKNDALQALLKTTVTQALDGRNLRLSSTPDLNLKVFKPGCDIECTVRVELLPEIPPLDPESLSLDKRFVPVTDDDVAQEVKRLVDDFVVHCDADDDYLATNKDIIHCYYTATVEGEVIIDDSRERSIIVGDKDIVPELGQALLGIKKGDARRFSILFPETGYTAQVAGKTVDYAISKVTRIEKAKTAATLEEMLNIEHDTMMHKSDHVSDVSTDGGPQSVESFAADIRKNLEENRDHQATALLKLVLLDTLDKQYSFDLPPSLLKEEYGHVLHRLDPHHHHDGADACVHDDTIQAKASLLASRRVKLGLILAEYGRTCDIQVTDDDIRREIHATAWRSGGRYREVLEFFANHKEAIDTVRASLFEKNVVDTILTKVQVHLIPTDRDTFDAAMTTHND